MGFVSAETDTETEMPILEDTPILKSQGIFFIQIFFWLLSPKVQK